jgi:molybdopterin synthase catalytic subunit/molybdopterin synthase sulfur carrier subunit
MSVANLRLFAMARETAGVAIVSIDALTVRELLDRAVDQFGEDLRSVIAISAIWVNGESATLDTALTEDDEVAVLPPVSGGSSELPILSHDLASTRHSHKEPRSRSEDASSTP